MSKLTQALIVVVVVLSVIAYGLFSHSEKLAQDKAELAGKVESKQATINTMAYQQLTAAKIDATHIQELNNAKTKLEYIERGVADGSIGLHVNANCSGMPGTSGASSMGDAESPRLGDAAQRDYFTLRERIITATSQINYLQSYIKNICNKPTTEAQQ